MPLDFDPINGNEVQLRGFNFSVHTGYEWDEVRERLEKNLKRVFDGESAHKIVRISHSSNQRWSTAVNAGFEHVLYEEVANYIKESVEKGRTPIVFEIMNFVTYTPLRVVVEAPEELEGDDDEVFDTEDEEEDDSQ